jgi:hypothetical protein
VGLRNRFGILSEAYSYASFRERVQATLAFVEANLDHAHRHAGMLARITEAADGVDLAGRTLPVRATFRRDGETEILMGEVEERLSRASGLRYLARQDVVRPVRMPEYGSFVGTEWETAPAAYYVLPGLQPVVDLLALHGVETDRLLRARVEQVEQFVVDSTRVDTEAFEGHRQTEVFGHWEPVRTELPAGTVVVPVAGQPLARLVFHLLEPRSDDGIVNWNVIALRLEASPAIYPILRRPPH